MYSMLIETVTAEFCLVVALQIPDASLNFRSNGKSFRRSISFLVSLVNLFLAMTSPSKYDQIPILRVKSPFLSWSNPNVCENPHVDPTGYAPYAEVVIPAWGLGTSCVSIDRRVSIWIMCTDTLVTHTHTHIYIYTHNRSSYMHRYHTKHTHTQQQQSSPALPRMIQTS